MIDDRAQRNRDGVGAMGGDCRKCGARRVDSQIGLERTPEEYVAALVGVFREVRRVLRDDGTLWLNLGDSYNAAGRNGHGTRDGCKQGTNRASASGDDENRPTAPFLKPKDLVGIPWRVAFALQQPYYTGAIKDERDRIWLAAMIDAEGCMFVHKRKAGSRTGQGYERQNDSYSPGLEVANTSKAIVDRCMAIVGKGSICSQSPEQNDRRKQTIYRWNLRTTECRDIIREVYPHLTAKQHQARLLCGCPSSGPDADAAHQSLMALHNGGSATIDFPAPASMFEPGWYLRSEIIWKKPNPMPESVTDRPTKSHEQIFLLSKSERYYYDAEAIKEASTFNPVDWHEDAWKGSIPGREGGPGQDRRQKRDSHKRGEFAGKNTEPGKESFRAISATRNRRDVWTVPTAPYSGAHFATFPPALIRPCILAGCPQGGTVLDPFGGSGTTAEVAEEEGRNSVVIELNPAYVTLAEKRTAQQGLFCQS